MKTEEEQMQEYYEYLRYLEQEEYYQLLEELEQQRQLIEQNTSKK